MRLFFALWPSSAVRAELARWTVAAGQPVDRRNLHLTLAFLGEQPSDALPRLFEAGRHLHMQPFRLRLDRLDCFPQSAVRVAMPSQVPAALYALRLDLRSSLASLGIRCEPESWRPHVTLTRRYTNILVQRDGLDLLWPVSDFCLIESLGAHGRTVYRVLARFGKNAANARSGLPGSMG